MRRLALNSFTDQKRRFFPHLDSEPSSKKQCVSQESLVDNPEDAADYSTLTNTLQCLEKEVPNVKIQTYERLEWLKRASSLPASENEDSFDTSMAQAYHGSSSLRPESPHVPSEKVAVIELFVPSVFRAVVSLHPVGSTDPDAVAFFSPDEVISFAMEDFISACQYGFVSDSCMVYNFTPELAFKNVNRECFYMRFLNAEVHP